jgi:hypothetical protein
MSREKPSTFICLMAWVLVIAAFGLVVWGGFWLQQWWHDSVLHGGE